MEDDHDFTFPTTTVPEEPGDVVDITVATPAAVLPGSAAPGASRLWPFAAPLTGATTTAAALKEEEDEAPASTTKKEEEQERATVVDDEDGMDMLWDDTAAAATTAPASARSSSRAKAEPQHPAAANLADEAADDERAAAIAEQERMDLLWESFNEELLLRRARSKTAAAFKQHGVVAASGPLPEPDYWYLCASSTSDAESEEASAVSSSPRYGCAPTMLRASSRAGGAGQFYNSPRRRTRSSRGGGWALLLRLFRRLFAVDKAAHPTRRHGIHVP